MWTYIDNKFYDEIYKSTIENIVKFPCFPENLMKKFERASQKAWNRI